MIFLAFTLHIPGPEFNLHHCITLRLGTTGSGFLAPSTTKRFKKINLNFKNLQCHLVPIKWHTKCINKALAWARERAQWEYTCLHVGGPSSVPWVPPETTVSNIPGISSKHCHGCTNKIIKIIIIDTNLGIYTLNLVFGFVLFDGGE